MFGWHFKDLKKVVAILIFKSLDSFGQALPRRLRSRPICQLTFDTIWLFADSIGAHLGTSVSSVKWFVNGILESIVRVSFCDCEA